MRAHQPHPRPLSSTVGKAPKKEKRKKKKGLLNWLQLPPPCMLPATTGDRPLAAHPRRRVVAPVRRCGCSHVRHVRYSGAAPSTPNPAAAIMEDHDPMDEAVRARIDEMWEEVTMQPPPTVPYRTYVHCTSPCKPCCKHRMHTRPPLDSQQLVSMPQTSPCAHHVSKAPQPSLISPLPDFDVVHYCVVEEGGG